LLSTGIDEVSREQTSLDISQGSRIDDRLYGRDLPQLSPRPTDQVAGWSQVVSRARSAPADLIPGLLATTLERAGVPVQADSVPTEAVPPATNVAGHVSRVGRVSRIGHVIPGRGHACYPLACPGFTVTAAVAEVLPSLISQLKGRDLMIALPVPADRGKPILIGIAGQGYRGGNLTSSSTRTDGYVLSTDLAPTILHRFGLSTPDQMDGEPIDAVGHRDPEALDDLADRMKVIPDRRAPVVILSLVGWIAVAGLVGLFLPPLRRRALAWLALAFAYMPLMLLAGAAIEPGAFAEGLLVGLGAAILAGVTMLRVRGWWALAVACGITVVAYAADMVTGSELTKLSLLGPNPIFGVRFYGIGNELEALIAVMVPVGVGAGLSACTGRGREVSRSGAVAAFLVAALIGALVFGAGRFGADVGAAIVLPVGAAVAAAVLSVPIGSTVSPSGRMATIKRQGQVVAAVVAAPILVLAALALIDLVSAGNAHLTRSVLDAGGAGDLADIAQRRFELSAHDFAQAARNPLFWLVIVGVCAGLAQRRRIDAWLRPAPLARAGFLGACAAVAAGVLVNDSGATFLVLGSLALGATLAFAWGRAPGTDP
jgi:hypothetical protein